MVVSDGVKLDWRDGRERWGGEKEANNAGKGGANGIFDTESSKGGRRGRGSELRC